MHNNVKMLNLENNNIGEKGCLMLRNYFENKKIHNWFSLFHLLALKN